MHACVAGMACGWAPQVTFPERAGALRQFLDAVSPTWNITLFHYRNTGNRESSVLLGVQVGPMPCPTTTTTHTHACAHTHGAGHRLPMEAGLRNSHHCPTCALCTASAPALQVHARAVCTGVAHVI